VLSFPSLFTRFGEKDKTMNSQGRGAVAEMSPFSRPARDPNTIPSGWGATTPMEIAGDPNTINSGWRHGSVSGEDDGNLMSTWQKPVYPIDVGFDPATFMSENKIALAIGAAVLAGGLAYYYGYR